MNKHDIFVMIDEKLNDSCMDNNVSFAIEQTVHSFLFDIISEESEFNVSVDSLQGYIGMDITAI